MQVGLLGNCKLKDIIWQFQNCVSHIITLKKSQKLNIERKKKAILLYNQTS